MPTTKKKAQPFINALRGTAFAEFDLSFDDIDGLLKDKKKYRTPRELVLQGAVFVEQVMTEWNATKAQRFIGAVMDIDLDGGDESSPAPAAQPAGDGGMGEFLIQAGLIDYRKMSHGKLARQYFLQPNNEDIITACDDKFGGATVWVRDNEGATLKAIGMWRKSKARPKKAPSSVKWKGESEPLPTLTFAQFRNEFTELCPITGQVLNVDGVSEDDGVDYSAVSEKLRLELAFGVVSGTLPQGSVAELVYEIQLDPPHPKFAKLRLAFARAQQTSDPMIETARARLRGTGSSSTGGSQTSGHGGRSSGVSSHGRGADHPSRW